jgi:hypothetical protein
VNTDAVLCFLAGALVAIGGSIALVFKWDAAKKRRFFLAKLLATDVLLLAAVGYAGGAVPVLLLALPLSLVVLSAAVTVRFCANCGATIWRRPALVNGLRSCPACGISLVD